MGSLTQRLFISFLCVISVVLCALAIPAVAWADSEVTLTRELVSDNPDLSNEAYLSQFTITPSSYSASRPAYADDMTIDKAFDGNWNTGYRADVAGETTFTVVFSETEKLSRILYRMKQDNKWAGYPLTLTLRVSATGEEGSFTDIATLSQDRNSEKSAGSCPRR